MGFTETEARQLPFLQLCITTSMMSIVKTLNSFPRERVTVCREMARGQGRGGYGAGAYLLSKMLVETPVDALFPALFGATVCTAFPTVLTHWCTGYAS